MSETGAESMGGEVRGGRRTAAAWVLTAVGIVWLAVFPLTCDFTYTHLTLAKWAAMGIGAGLTLGGLAAAAILRGGLRLRTRSLRIFALFLGWIALSGLFGAGAGNRTADGLPVTLLGARHEGLISWLGYGLIFFTMAQAKARLEVIVPAAADALALQLLLIALQYANLNPLSLFPNRRSILTNYEFQGTFGNIDMLAGYLSLVLPLTLVPWALRGGWGRGLAAMAGMGGVLLCLLTEVQAGKIMLAVLGLGILVLFLTRPETRWRCMILLYGAALCLLLRGCIRLPWLGETGAEHAALALPSLRRGLVCGAVMALSCGLAVLFRFFPGKALRGRWALLILACIVTLALLTVALLPVPESAGGLWEIHETLNFRARDGFGSERVGIWRTALGLIREHPLFGLGYGNFQRASLQWQAANGMTLAQRFDNPHNFPLELAVNAGVPAMLLFGWLAVTLLRACRRDREHGPAIALCLACWLAQSFFSFSICITSPMAWAVFGLIAAGEPEVRRPAGTQQEAL